MFRLRRNNSRTVFAVDFVLGGALDENRPASATVYEMQRLLEPNALGRLLELRVENVE
jgi:hypothetical protein